MLHFGILRSLNQNFNKWRRILRCCRVWCTIPRGVFMLICENLKTCLKMVNGLFCAWPSNLWLFVCQFPLQRGRQILWRVLGTNTFYGLKIQFGTGKICLCLESCLEIKWVHLEALLCPFPCLHFLVPMGVTGHFLCIQVTAWILSPRMILACLCLTDRWFRDLPDDTNFLSGCTLFVPVQGKPAIDWPLSIKLLICSQW